jgi:hypothetical protein
MKVGLVDVDGKNFPNYALMKISAWHKERGDEVEWADAMFGEYDRVYMSKVFTFTEDNRDVWHCEVVKGGTGYDIESKLPDEIDAMQCDYSIYPSIDAREAYGFLTRGCPNKCPWCVVPKKEGKVRPYRDIEEIAVDGRNKVVLMDNNVLASDWGLAQIEKIMKLGLRVDFNQGLDARLITEDIARMLAKVKWIDYIRLACDKKGQIPHILKAHELLEKYGYKKDIFCYFLIDDWDDVNERLNALRRYKWFKPHGQPYRDFGNNKQIIPKWQKDMAHWMNKHNVYFAVDFKDFEPRKGFKCSEYFK